MATSSGHRSSGGGLCWGEECVRPRDQNKRWAVLTAPGPCERHGGSLEHNNGRGCGLSSARIVPNGDEQRPSKQQRRHERQFTWELGKCTIFALYPFFPIDLHIKMNRKTGVISRRRVVRV